MKTKMVIKFCLILPVLLLADYIAMVMLGCASCLFGFGADYYCNTYCVIGKGILLLSAIIFGIIIYPDLMEMIKQKWYGTTQEE